MTRSLVLFDCELASATDGIGRDVIDASRSSGNGTALKFRTCGLGCSDALFTRKIQIFWFYALGGACYARL